MPTYEYRCKDCGHSFDIVQSFSDDALTECPSCGGSLKKVFGNVGIAFKGSGFYKTDSRSGSSKGSAAAASSAPGSSPTSAGDGGSSGSSGDGASSGSSDTSAGTAATSSTSAAPAAP